MGNLGLDMNCRVDGQQALPGAYRFGHGFGSILLAEKELPVQIAKLHKIAVHQREPPQAGACQSFRLQRPQGPATNNDYVSVFKFRLSVFTPIREENLPAKSVFPFVGGDP